MGDDPYTSLVIAGGLLLVAIFVASFLLKTSWGQWNDRTKQDEIFGKPGKNMDHINRRHARDNQ